MRASRGVANQRGGRASERIVEQLRKRIREGQLNPGDRLPPERELCEQHGVSRVTIREALRVLEAGGLVDIRLGSRGGAFITAPSPERIEHGLADYLALSALPPEQIHEARMVMELGLLPLACERANAADLERLARSCNDLDKAREQGRSDTRAERDFHLYLAGTAQNEAIEMLLRPLYGAAPQLQPTGGGPSTGGAGGQPGRQTTQQDVDEHRGVVEAIREGNVARATALLRTHIARSTPDTS